MKQETNFKRHGEAYSRAARDTETSACSLPLCHLWSGEGSMKVFFTSTVFRIHSHTRLYVSEIYNFSFSHKPLRLFLRLVFSESSRSLGIWKDAFSSFLLHPLPIVSYRLQLTPGSAGNVTKVTPGLRAQLNLPGDSW